MLGERLNELSLTMLEIGNVLARDDQAGEHIEAVALHEWWRRSKERGGFGFGAQRVDEATHHDAERDGFYRAGGWAAVA
jgi:hypothetical protein